MITHSSINASEEKLFRLIDANLNRTREGMRVCEDILRFILDSKPLTRAFKSLRHRIGRLTKKITNRKEYNRILLKNRDVKSDVGKKTYGFEKKRKNIYDVYCANLQRIKESLRVLEEITKLSDKNVSNGFKRIRFDIYELEKKSCGKLETILHNR